MGDKGSGTATAARDSSEEDGERAELVREGRVERVGKGEAEAEAGEEEEEPSSVQESVESHDAEEQPLKRGEGKGLRWSRERGRSPTRSEKSI
jgi:hypothetical protein